MVRENRKLSRLLRRVQLRYADASQFYYYRPNRSRQILACLCLWNPVPALMVISTMYVRLSSLLNDLGIARADAICDRLVHNAYQLNLKRESMRKLLAKLN